VEAQTFESFRRIYLVRLLRCDGNNEESKKGRKCVVHCERESEKESSSERITKTEERERRIENFEGGVVQVIESQEIIHSGERGDRKGEGYLGRIRLVAEPHLSNLG
jgi:hypothetical protein